MSETERYLLATAAVFLIFGVAAKIIEMYHLG